MGGCRWRWSCCCAAFSWFSARAVSGGRLMGPRRVGIASISATGIGRAVGCGRNSWPSWNPGPKAAGASLMPPTSRSIAARAIRPGGQGGQALGHTKDGLNTKLHAVVDEAGQPVSLLLSAGNDADISHAPTVLAEIAAAMVVADKGYHRDAFRQWRG